MLSDEELLRRIERRDQRALALLYERYAMTVYSLTYRILQNAQLAEEATQDTFMKVWRLSDRWDGNKGKFAIWLLTVARYTAIDLLRMENRHNNVPIDNIAPPTTEKGLPDDPLRQDGHALRALLKQIPQEQAQAIELAFFYGLTHEELARHLNLPLGTVKTRVRLGLQKLRLLWVQRSQESFNDGV